MVFASEDTINTITNTEEQTYQKEDLQPYKLDQVGKAFNAAVSADKGADIDEDCYKLPGEFKFDIDKDDWIDTLVNLHYSNVRTRNAAKNRINKDNIGKWTYASKDEYPAIKNLNVEGSMEAMKDLIKQALKNPNVQYTVTNAAEFLGAAFFELVKSLKPKYEEYLKTGNTKCFLDYNKHYLYKIFNQTLDGTKYIPYSGSQALYRDFIYYVQDFDMLPILNNVLYVHCYQTVVAAEWNFTNAAAALDPYVYAPGYLPVPSVILTLPITDKGSGNELETKNYDNKYAEIAFSGSHVWRPIHTKVKFKYFLEDVVLKSKSYLSSKIPIPEMAQAQDTQPSISQHAKTADGLPTDTAAKHEPKKDYQTGTGKNRNETINEYNSDSFIKEYFTLFCRKKQNGEKNIRLPKDGVLSLCKDFAFQLLRKDSPNRPGSLNAFFDAIVNKYFSDWRQPQLHDTIAFQWVKDQINEPDVESSQEKFTLVQTWWTEFVKLMSFELKAAAVEVYDSTFRQ